ncbi:hypothetical protein MNQ98_15140 [Paenibacillus sp. N3/727]|uniref:hypothetical protein n=1 Tax=Paenibacillus sp. N3/727 TaxID=2925845 RepID=UPI001F53D34C|nr:hypothetical protein [Paenibacillus sp. N3/727]UNK15893.1 hypothetical protein MNQ98_15140 [Paenibacillus sp. N3/727]
MENYMIRHILLKKNDAIYFDQDEDAILQYKQEEDHRKFWDGYKYKEASRILPLEALYNKLISLLF